MMLGSHLSRHDDVLVWFPMSETSGEVITDSVSGVQLRPADVGDGSLQFTLANAVRVNVNSSNSDYPLHAGTWPLLHLDKVLLNAAAIKCVDPNHTRIPMGAAVSPGQVVFTLSFGGAMHAILGNSNGANLEAVREDNVLVETDSEYIIYSLWTGRELFARALNMDGSVFLECSVNNEITVSGITYRAFKGSEILQPSNDTRLGGAHYYGWGVWQFDELPDALDAWLTSMAAQWKSGDKRPYLA